ncbi:sugar phosphate isomerase/epimerase, partial [Escherichia coli]|nr:sugar phosphate isomerase/epimerase [Escherichia coli]
QGYVLYEGRIRSLYPAQAYCDSLSCLLSC